MTWIDQNVFINITYKHFTAMHKSQLHFRDPDCFCDLY